MATAEWGRYFAESSISLADVSTGRISSGKNTGKSSAVPDTADLAPAPSVATFSWLPVGGEKNIPLSKHIGT